MTTRSGSGEDPDKPPTPKPGTPKRGAFPTPASEKEKAERYIPDTDKVDESTKEEHDPSTEVDSEKEG